MRAYSQRLAWNSPANRISHLLDEQRARGAPLLDLTISNPTEAFREYPHEAIRSAYSDISDFTYHPEPPGEPAARTAIADWYREQDIRSAPEQILLTASSSEAYALLFKLLCNPGDEILVPVPSYPLFEFLAALECVGIVPYRLLYDGAWFIDFSTLRNRITSRTRAIVIVNPNNPTGSFLKRFEKEQLITLAVEHELPIISDEVFMNYSLGDLNERVQTMIGCDSVLSFSLNGLSKAAGMPQVKLGWIALNGPAQEREIARNRLELLLDSYLSVSTPVQRALPRLLEIGNRMRRQIAERLTRNLDTLDRLLVCTTAHRLHVEGGWSAILQLPNVSDEESWVARLIEQRGVIVQPGYFFDMEPKPYTVVSLLTDPEVFEQGIRAIASLLEA
ncbi:MAG: pyridoxal phosphate-dependent aminotransferase [Acidobacteriaceae bacterium]|nr:pyridoxal phosphate-dependent aminotransferase [Acidobacteriaceae bacterium]